MAIKDRVYARNSRQITRITTAKEEILSARSF